MGKDQTSETGIRVYEVTLRPLDFTFFATSEQNQRTIVNVEVIHNYSLMYAISHKIRCTSADIVRPNYDELFNPESPWYCEHYATPAILKTVPRKVVQTYNSTSEAVWYGLAMDKKGRLNFPRMGSWEKLAPWTSAQGWAEYVFIMLHWGRENLDSRETIVRVGKKRSPSRLHFKSVSAKITNVKSGQLLAYNPRDCDESKLSIESYRLGVIPPSPVVLKARGSGVVLKLEGVSERLSPTAEAYLPIPKYLEDKLIS